MIEKICLFVVIINIVYASGQEYDFDYSQCEKHTRCGACLFEDPMCNWCADENLHLFTQFARACSSRDRLVRFGCSPHTIQSSKKSKIEHVEDKIFSDIVGEDSVKAVQIRPQKLSITFSPFETQTFTFTYRPAKNNPLDLYFLMDLTWSMKDDKDTLVKLRDDLGDALSNFTEYSRLAFGSFADKPLMPYVSTEERRRANPCFLAGETCDPTYDFRHRLKFSNVKKFVDALNSSEVTANLDNAEGGMDALMQILVCGDQIGWGPTSRKMVIFATDGLSHFAGDGKLGGAVKPNDEMCHLTADGYYAQSENMDYPTLEQIYHVLQNQKETADLDIKEYPDVPVTIDEVRKTFSTLAGFVPAANVSVIFAVTKEIESYYERIKQLLPKNTFVGRLESDSSNILALIQRGYEYITSVINFDVDDIDDDIEFTLFSNCGDDNRPLAKTSKCTNVKIGETYTFTVNMTMKTKKSNRQTIADKKKTIVIRDTQLGLEVLTLEINMATACECPEMEPKFKCPTNANFECGKCVCLPGWSGKDCDCNKDKAGALSNTEGCRSSNEKVTCSGNGDCFCDSCQCDPGWTGKFCECTSCPINAGNGEVCGGKNRGTCMCGGACACRRGWSGSSCSCSDTLCTSPWNNDLCSGNGVCRCGKCKCIEKGGNNYTGRYCETCATCINPACSLYEECVRNELQLQVSTKDPCISKDGTLFIPKNEAEFHPESSDVQECLIKINDETSKDFGCKYVFTYLVQKNWNTVLTIFPKECPVSFKAASTYLFMAVSAALGIGLLCAIIWKICDYYSYKREYRKFQEEQWNILEMMKKEEAVGETDKNPLYISPKIQYEVPKNYYREHVD